MPAPWFRRRKQVPAQNAHGAVEPSYHTSPVSIVVLIGLLPLAFLLLFIGSTLHLRSPIYGAILEHFASALVVASIIGLSYESLLHKHREKALRQILADYQNRMYDAVAAYGKTTPKEVFGLLKDIAKQTNKMPTLYEPARDKAGEYTFANTCEFFETLINVQATDVRNVLKEWTGPNEHHNVRFLLSDFVGRYRLTELTELLKAEAEKNLSEWKSLDLVKKRWTLNYVWAVSRCEDPRYQWLEQLLLQPPDNDTIVPEWILFIPQQMPEDHEFLDMIEKYLESGPPRHQLPAGLIQDSLAALEKKHPGKGKRILELFASLLATDHEWEKTQTATAKIEKELPSKLLKTAESHDGLENREDKSAQ